MDTRTHAYAHMHAHTHMCIRMRASIKIYTIRFYDDNNLIYVGSTIQSLYKRFADHKRRANNEKKKLMIC